MSGLKSAADLDLIELDSQTGFHELAFRAALNGSAPKAISQSGGAFAQNPYFCTGLINAAEAILQLSDQAGADPAAGHQAGRGPWQPRLCQPRQCRRRVGARVMAKNVVALIGSGQTKFKTHYADKTYIELAQDAAKLALDDAGMEPGEIDAVVFSMAPTQFMGVNDCDRWATSHVWGGRESPSCASMPAGATGGSALQAGYVHIASGRLSLGAGGGRRPGGGNAGRATHPEPDLGPVL